MNGGRFGAMKHRLQSYILLSIAAAVVTLLLKLTAYLLTNSVGLVSEAVESLVNLVAAVAAFFTLRLAAAPADRNHTYGHEKIEFFSSGIEGVLIAAAGVGIIGYAVHRLLDPEMPTTLGLGMALTAIAAGINGIVGFVLLRAGRKHESIVLEADGKHLLTDVFTTAGVVFGLCLVWLTEKRELDALAAIAVAFNILWTAFGLLRRSFNGLMDHALPVEEQKLVRAAIAAHLGPRMAYHALRTRQAGARRFVDFHLLVPGSYRVDQAHRLGDEIEVALRALLPQLEVTVHIEPIEEAASWEDSALVPLEQADQQRTASEKPPA
jgi:cation diffusion facilitator family transporter